MLTRQQKPDRAHSHPMGSPEWTRPQSSAVIASPASSLLPLPVSPGLGFAFCSNKENVFKNLLTLLQREAVIDAVRAGE